MERTRSVLLILALLLASCSAPHAGQEKGSMGPNTDKPVHDSAAGPQGHDARSFLAAYNQDFEKLDRANNEAYWKAANSGKTEDFNAFAATDLALKTLHSDPKRYQEIQTLLAAPDLLDPVERRALQVAELKFKGNQLPADLLKKMVDSAAAIEQTFNTFRPTVDGQEKSNNDILEALSKETDSTRRKALWEGLKQVGEQVGGRLVELARLRNQAAGILGFKNYWEMMIVLQEHDPDGLVALFDELAKATDEPFRKMKERLDGELSRRFSLAPDKMMLWHYDNPFFQQAPPSESVDLDIFYRNMKKEEIVALGAHFFSEIGLPADEVVALSDYYEREGKDQHAFCISVDRNGDVRTLLNVKPTAEWMDTMLHETGHAVYEKYIDRTLPYNLREPSHILTTEAVAMLFGALAKNPTWLVGYAGADRTEVERLEKAIIEQRRREQLIFARWTLVMFHFERALYADPEQDLNTLWYDLVEQYQMLTRPEGRNLPDWAAKPHFTIAPVYYHNYLLGELLAAQLRSVLARMAGHTGGTATLDFRGHEEFGKLFRDKVFSPGSRGPWQEFVRECTGSPLGITAYVAEVQ